MKTLIGFAFVLVIAAILALAVARPDVTTPADASDSAPILNMVIASARA